LRFYFRNNGRIFHPVAQVVINAILGILKVSQKLRQLPLVYSLGIGMIEAFLLKNLISGI
jgi:hypothetical protein